MGAIPWVLLQLVLVAVVIFIPQTVTVFLDKEVVVDIDKVKIEAPVEAPLVPASGADPLKPAEPGASEAEEQKKIDELFNKK
jgi:hypothetical protein